MTAIFVGYLAISYTFSGLFCYLAFLRSANKQLQPKELQRHPVPLKIFALTLLWPLWMVRESLGDNNWQDDRIYFLEPEKIYPEVGFESLPQADSSFHSQANKFGLASSTKTRIKIMIPKHYQREPVISRLTSDYGLTFYITEAMLGASNQEEGLFDLELDGTPQQIKSALDYLLKLQVKVSVN